MRIWAGTAITVLAGMMANFVSLVSTGYWLIAVAIAAATVIGVFLSWPVKDKSRAVSTTFKGEFRDSNIRNVDSTADVLFDGGGYRTRISRILHRPER